MENVCHQSIENPTKSHFCIVFLFCKQHGFFRKLCHGLSLYFVHFLFKFFVRLICIVLLKLLKIDEFIFMILTHLAFRNCLTTSRCMVISTIYVVYLDTYTLETKMSGSLLFLALKWPFLWEPCHLIFQLKSKFYKKRGATFFYEVTRKLGPLDFTQYRSKSSSF